MIRDRIHLVPLLTLTAVWVLLWGNLSFANVVSGMALGALVLFIFPLPPLASGVKIRPLPLFTLLWKFNWDLISASIEVALQVFTRGPRAQGVIFEAPLQCRDELLQTITAEMVSLVPGTVVIDLDSERGVLTVHALEITDHAGAEKVRASIRAQEQRVLKALAKDPDCGKEAAA
ncbi:Na+/H+ antiporter subunit E [Dermacoccaceae bacterium W4C1]